jgi:hypothetical protein
LDLRRPFTPIRSLFKGVASTISYHVKGKKVVACFNKRVETAIADHATSNGMGWVINNCVINNNALAENRSDTDLIADVLIANPDLLASVNPWSSTCTTTSSRLRSSTMDLTITSSQTCTTRVRLTSSDNSNATLTKIDCVILRGSR